jgi:hypothetical protein
MNTKDLAALLAAPRFNNAGFAWRGVGRASRPQLSAVCMGGRDEPAITELMLGDTDVGRG